MSYTFPPGTTIAAGQILALAENRSTYLAAYGTNTPVPFDVFEGVLDPDGETLTLIQPGSNGGVSTVVDRVRYEARLPWPENANGSGASLQLVDPTQDNSRPSNWTDRQGWQQITVTGAIQGGASPGTNLAFFATGGAGNFYVDDVVLVTGLVANAGLNLVVNGDFESALDGSWEATGNHANSVVSTTIAHAGGRSMHVVGAGLGGPTAAVRQKIPAFATNTVCTMTYWFRPGTNGVQAQVRAFSGTLFNSIVSLRPAHATPGMANNDQRPLPPYDPLWLNELQPENTAGPVDNFGEREPWIELHNAGTNT